jgi:uncharacterized membrane protein YgaE (UPF0421/DUF939 family)
LRSAALSLVTIGLILAAEALFVRLTHALQLPLVAGMPGAEAAKVASADHEYLVVMMLLGAMVGMISSFGVSDPKAKGQLITMLLLPIPMVAALALGLALGGDRILCLVLLPVITAAGTYLRRFGPRGMVAGILLFLGFFLGFFLHKAVTVHDLGWLTAAIGVGLAVAIAVRFLLFFPDQAKAIQRTQRSFATRAQKVAGLVLGLFDDPDPGAARRLHGHLLRLNEAALMIDAQLGDPAAVADGSSRQQLHQRLFDFELALSNVARFSEALARLDLPEAVRSEIRLALLDVVRRNAEGAKHHAEHLGELLENDEGLSPTDTIGTRTILLHRFAGSIVALADAGTDWLSIQTTWPGPDEFEPAVALFAGWLPGSAGVSSTASTESGHRLGDRVRLQPWTRAAVQMGVALGVATLLGDLINPSRYYWAVIAVFITFMGVNNSGEQTRKALFRVGGTVIGIGIGSLVVDAVGHHTDGSIAVIMVSLFFGFYLMRVNYTFMVIAITVMVSQLYQELGEFSNTLLLFRLAETAVGAAVAIVVVTFVVPLRTRRVLRVAFRDHVRAIGALVDRASEVLMTVGPIRGEDRLRGDARAVDASYQALVATAQPLRRNLFGNVDEELSRAVALASVSRNYSRDLVADLASTAPLDPGLQGEISRATATLHRSMDTVADAMTGPREGIYVRSSSLYDQVERSLEDGVVGLDQGCPAIRDLILIDGSMATLAQFIGLAVTDFDTVGAA